MKCYKPTLAFSSVNFASVSNCETILTDSLRPGKVEGNEAMQLVRSRFDTAAIKLAHINRGHLVNDCKVWKTISTVLFPESDQIKRLIYHHNLSLNSLFALFKRTIGLAIFEFLLPGYYISFAYLSLDCQPFSAFTCPFTKILLWPFLNTWKEGGLLFAVSNYLSSAKVMSTKKFY